MASLDWDGSRETSTRNLTLSKVVITLDSCLTSTLSVKLPFHGNTFRSIILGFFAATRPLFFPVP